MRYWSQDSGLVRRLCNRSLFFFFYQATVILSNIVQYSLAILCKVKLNDEEDDLRRITEQEMDRSRDASQL